MDKRLVINHIVEWMKEYGASSGTEGFVVGVSGGIDSALVSTLAAMTGRKTVCVTLPIHQASSQVSRADEHIGWLEGRFGNVVTAHTDLTGTYEALVGALPMGSDEELQHLTNANTRSRLRMTALYYYAGIHRCLVAGTGNKIEDFGIGFFTKYGDGGVDFSPIADLTKSEVYALAGELGIVESIRSARPTDGLYGDDRTDEDQIGASYPELEWAMEQSENGAVPEDFTGRRREVFDIYLRRNRANRHKTEPVPVCRIPGRLRGVE